MVQQNIIHNSCRPLNFWLPDFMAQWPYERHLHPDYGTVDVESAIWINEHRFFSVKAQKSFDASLFGLLGCLVFPLNTKDFCRTGCDLANVYFVIDEFNDVAEPEVAVQVCDVVMDVLRNPYKERKPEERLGIFMQDSGRGPGQEVQRTRVVTLFPEESQEGLLTREELKAMMQ